MSGSIDPDRWVEVLATRLGVPSPSADEVEDLLSLAGSAAHAAERWVAPVSTWLVARAGLAPAEARAAVEALADELTTATDPGGATTADATDPA